MHAFQHLGQKLAALVWPERDFLSDEVHSSVSLASEQLPLTQQSKRWDEAELFAAILTIKATAASSIRLQVERRTSEGWDSDFAPGSPEDQLQNLLDNGRTFQEPGVVLSAGRGSGHPLAEQVHTPRRELIRSMMVSMDVTGRGIIEMRESGARLPGAMLPAVAELQFHAPRNPRVSVDKQRLTIQDPMGQTVTIPAERLIVWEQVDPVSGNRITSAWKTLKKTVRADLYASQWQQNTFRRGVRKDGIITPDNDSTWSTSEFERIEEKIKEFSGPDNAGGIVISSVPGKLTLSDAVTPKEMDFQGSRQQLIIYMCSVLGVPPSLVLHETKFANFIQGRASMWQDRVGPWVSAFAELLTNSLVPRFGKLGQMRIVGNWRNERAALGDIGEMASAYLNLRNADVPHNDAAQAVGLPLPRREPEEMQPIQRPISGSSGGSGSTGTASARLAHHKRARDPRKTRRHEPVRIYALTEEEERQLDEDRESSVEEIAALLFLLGSRLDLDPDTVDRQLKMGFPASEIYGGTAKLQDEFSDLDEIVKEWYARGLDDAGVAFSESDLQDRAQQFILEVKDPILEKVEAGARASGVRLGGDAEIRRILEETNITGSGELWLALFGLDERASGAILNKVEAGVYKSEDEINEGIDKATKNKAAAIGLTQVSIVYWGGRRAARERWQWRLSDGCNHDIQGICIRLEQLPPVLGGMPFVDPATGVEYMFPGQPHPRCCCWLEAV